VREILSHTSGMPFKSKLEEPTLDRFTLAERVKSYAATPLKSEPGTKYSYSNAGINTAGRLIEVLSGMTYETFLQKRILDPLGMKDTTYWPNKDQLQRLAKGHKPNADKSGLEETRIGQLWYPLDNPERRPMPAGGLFSTATDVAVFCQMVLNGGTWKGKKILSEKSVALMTSKQTPNELKDGYGHGGAMATNMSIDTKRGMITVYLVQNAGFPKEWKDGHGVFQHAAEKLFDGMKK
jgi:CubicO group peptidase (beta-lactamase class C family)